ncbi:MAG: formylglycine-generating enzyme family protein [Methylococcaceae bacterium]
MLNTEPDNPSWALDSGRDSKGLWVEFEQTGNTCRIYLPKWGGKLEHDKIGLFTDLAIKGVIQRCRWIPPGIFCMGSPSSEKERHDNEIQHQVTLSQGFWLADTACTQALWMAVMGDNPAFFTENENNPVEQVSWDDVRNFIKQLNILTSGLGAQLPTEAQWEYACRAGTATPFSFGETITPDQVNYDGNIPYANEKKGRCREKTVAVKSLQANSWGLYEMHGNVWEWCSDWYDDFFDKPIIDPIGSDTGSSRVLRGGSWSNHGWRTRSANRGWYAPVNRDNYIGFRFVVG